MANSHLLHYFFKPKSSSLTFLILLIISTFVPQQVLSQQTYVGSAPAIAPTACTRKVDASPGYTSNGVFGACHAFITFRAATPYRTIHSISRLFKTDPSLVSAAISSNNITESTILELTQLVVIEANCSSPGITSYYKTSYIAQTGDSVYSIANQVYQGLTTCRAIFDHNPTVINQASVAVGTEIMVPIRCACPTETQTEDGIKSLLTYIVTEGDTVVDVSARFKVDQGLTFKANKLSKHHQIYPFTTLLLPIVRTRPDMSAAAQAQPPSPRHDQYVTPSPSKAKKSNGGAVLRCLFILLGIAGTVGLGITFKINGCTCIIINKVPP